MKTVIYTIFECPTCKLELSKDGICPKCFGKYDVNDECTWAQDDAYDGDGNYNTSCGEIFTFIDDTPKGNGMKFCCYCGKPLQEKLYEQEPEEDTLT